VEIADYTSIQHDRVVRPSACIFQGLNVSLCQINPNRFHLEGNGDALAVGHCLGIGAHVEGGAV
jgi:hypothetical protein